MNLARRPDGQRGFALILTLILLGMLVLLVLAMTALSRIDSQQVAVAVPGMQARQNALLGLRLAMGELQRHAGRDDRVTGMAGITGVAAGAGHPTRHWCGVWAQDGAFLSWLSTGGEAGSLPLLTEANSIVMLASGSLGTDGTDKEHVRVLKLPIEDLTQEGSPRLQGHYAYWVGDEGIKMSATTQGHAAIVPGLRHALGELDPALATDSPRFAKVLTYAQLAFVPTTPLTPGRLQSNLHSLTVAHVHLNETPYGLQPRAGAINVNTTNARLWRGVAATYNQTRPGTTLGITTATFANRLRDGLSQTTGPGKYSRGPFLTVAAIRDTPLLESALKGSGVKREDFLEAVGAMFTTRSDTFRIRAYGEAVHPLNPAELAATAFCEAIVQRTAASLPGHGRRFVITSFRWLGPGDI